MTVAWKKWATILNKTSWYHNHHNTCGKWNIKCIETIICVTTLLILYLILKLQYANLKKSLELIPCYFSRHIQGIDNCTCCLDKRTEDFPLLQYVSQNDIYWILTLAIWKCTVDQSKAFNSGRTSQVLYVQYSCGHKKQHPIP